MPHLICLVHSTISGQQTQCRVFFAQVTRHHLQTPKHTAPLLSLPLCTRTVHSSYYSYYVRVRVCMVWVFRNVFSYMRFRLRALLRISAILCVRAAHTTCICTDMYLDESAAELLLRSDYRTCSTDVYISAARCLQLCSQWRVATHFTENNRYVVI